MDMSPVDFVSRTIVDITINNLKVPNHFLFIPPLQHSHTIAPKHQQLGCLCETAFPYHQP